LPDRADDSVKRETETNYAVSTAQDVKLHSLTISALYERR